MSFCCPIHGYYHPVPGATAAPCPVCSAPKPIPAPTLPPADFAPLVNQAIADALVASQAEAKKLRDALDALTHAAREFSTAASYKVEGGIEEEFVAALDDAEELVHG